MAYETSLSGGHIFEKRATRPLQDNVLQFTVLLFGQFFHFLNSQPKPILSEDAKPGASRNRIITSGLPQLSLNRN
jgi:hypothetical protein